MCGLHSHACLMVTLVSSIQQFNGRHVNVTYRRAGVARTIEFWDSLGTGINSIAVAAARVLKAIVHSGQGETLLVRVQPRRFAALKK